MHQKTIPSPAVIKRTLEITQHGTFFPAVQHLNDNNQSIHPLL
jgi:hypothetical protein